MLSSQREIHQQAKVIFQELGLSEKQAITLFFEQVALKKTLPFPFRNTLKEKDLLVNVSVSEGIWTAECDELGLVTEAENYEELMQRALDIAPELAELNHVENFRLRFVQ